MEQPVGIEDGELRAQGCGRPITAGRRWDDECRWIYLLTILLWSSDAIATGTLFDVYFSDLARRQGFQEPNEFVGIMESSRGITCLLAAIPLGCLFDRFDRLCVLRVCVLCFGLSGAVTLAVSILTERLPLAVPGLALYAVYFQAGTGSLDALLADALPPQQRTAAYATARTLQTASRALGPFLQAVVMFIVPSKQELSKLLLAGYVGLAAFLLILWPLRVPEASPRLLAASGADHSEHSHEKILKIPKHILVPGIAMVFNLFIMLGGGITLKFFPIFYHQEYRLSEMAVCLIMAGYWLMTALGSYMAAFISRIARRVVLVLGTAFLGAALLFLFVVTKPLPWSLAIFEFRPLINNAHFALNTALTMEYALPQHRGKWASLGSLNRATFAGSAVLGGYISDAYGYRLGFAVTGCFCMCGVLVYSPMWCLVRHP
ncbi:Uncharacterized protein SCF082_LOCUS7431 [Durusdinium trenchii]|uniref:Major facilitator superfamily (MFS) profile domain-containing protein n=1 Tax=Durusdinium trenchii TaxID=1381693 RepID=A0ABP0IJ75_9DINO